MSRKLSIEKLVSDSNIKAAASPYANCLDNLAMDEVAHYGYSVIILQATYRDKMSFLTTILADGVVNSQIIHALNCKKLMLIATNLLKIEYPINVVRDERKENVINAQTMEDDSLEMTDDDIRDHQICFFSWL